MPRAPIRILIVAALCVATLIGIVVREGMARDSGREIVMAMAAIDPRALLQGHYVIVALQETLPADAPCPPSLDAEQFFSRGDNLPTSWLALSPVGERHSVRGAALTQQEAAQLGDITVRGRAACFKPTVIEGEQPQPGVLQTELGVDRFHINQTQAERIERIMRDQTPGEEARVFAILSIGADGRARMKGLIVDGERLTLDWL
ncbi:MAG TPA: GDYXXLXY domain-containing protein [Terricaulis sp.]|nr:GDYXXLXY domain-containing protein [Terricaulis sp.]